MGNTPIDVAPNGSASVRQPRFAVYVFSSSLSNFPYSSHYSAGAVPAIVLIHGLLSLTKTFVYCHVAVVHMMSNFDLTQIQAAVHHFEAYCFVTLCTAVVVTVDMLYTCQ
jgi:hypothetical protein